MAKYILTFSTDRPTGSLGGSTFQKSGTVFAIRKRNVPVQKRTPRQSEVKNKFDHVQKNWKNLSLAEQQTFIDESPNYPRIDSLGNSYIVMGSNLQGSANLSLLAAEQPEITSIVSPEATEPLAVQNIFLTPSLFILSVSTNPLLIPAGFTLKTFCTRPISQGAAVNETNDYKLISSRPAGTATNANQWIEYSAVFSSSPANAGQIIWVKFVLVSNASGQINNTVIGSGPVL